jgi:hypothetical protein
MGTRPPALVVLALVGLALAIGTPAASAHAPSGPDGLTSQVHADVPAEPPRIDAVAVQDGVLYVRSDDEPFNRAFDPATETLRLVAIPPKKRDAITPVTTSCIATDPDVCYRAVPRSTAIEESADGGATWSRAWGLARADLEGLARARSVDVEFDPSDFRISSVAVASTADGYVVLAAAEYDGLVMRHEDGTWERIGFADGRVPALDADPTLLRSYPQVWALGAFCLLLALYTEARGMRGRSPGRFVVGTVFLILGVLAAAVAILGNRVQPWSEAFFIAAFMLGMGAVFAVAATLLGAALSAGSPGSRFPSALGLAVLGSVAVWATTTLIPTPPAGGSWAVHIAVGTVTLGAFAVGGMHLMRRGEPAAA